jgi:hypothetical protein
VDAGGRPQTVRQASQSNSGDTSHRELAFGTKEANSVEHGEACYIAPVCCDVAVETVVAGRSGVRR